MAVGAIEREIHAQLDKLLAPEGDKPGKPAKSARS